MTDRQLLWGAGAIAAALVIATVVFSPALVTPPSKIPSTYSASEGGARAAFVLLQELHYPVRRWEEPPLQLPSSSNSSAVLVLAEPTQPPTDGDRKELMRFVSDGGRVLFCGPRIQLFFPAAELTAQAEAELLLTSKLPSVWTRDAREIVLQSASVWEKLGSRTVALYGNEDGAAVVSWKQGRGQVLWWAAATPLTNAGIRRKDNLQLFLNAVSSVGRGERPEIYWDEYFHGERSSLWTYVETTVMKWGLIQLALITGLILPAFSRRWGPVFRPREVSRLSPLEFVDTLGGLYQRASATSVPISVSYRHLKLSMARRLGLPASSEDGDFASAAQSRLGWDGIDLARLLQQAAAGQSRRLRASEALALVSGLEEYRHRLRGPGRYAAELARQAGQENEASSGTLNSKDGLGRW